VIVIATTSDNRGSPPGLPEGLADYLATVRRALGPPRSLEEIRLIADRDAHLLAYPRPAGMAVFDTIVVAAGANVRLYRPTGDGTGPAILYWHGGGFTTGSIDSYDGLATALAEATAATVISVDYARLPETTPRAMLQQAYEILAWAHRQADLLGIDGTQLAIAGDSAGAFLAAHLAVLARDRGGPAIACQLLCYGVYDLDSGREGHAAAHDPVLPRPVIDAMIATYRACAARDDAPLPAPLGIADLSRLPPAILLGAALDPMLAEAGDYAQRLRAAGGTAVERVAPGMCHGFLRAVRFSAPARAEMGWLGRAFRDLLQPSRTAL